MSSRRNNSDEWDPDRARRVWGSLVAAVVVVVAMLIIAGTSRHPRGAPSPYAPVQDPLPGPNPIDRLLAPGGPAARTDGIAVAVLVDVSGSMEDVVSDASGQRVPKIEIARRSMVNLVAQAEQAAGKAPERKLRLGVYEFSRRDRQPSTREVIPLGPPDAAAARRAVTGMRAEGGTPIGDALLHAKRALDATGLSREHILVITDGENNAGYQPQDVVSAMGRQAEPDRAAVYFVAFDVAAARFDAVRQAGGLVLSAADEKELQQTLDFVLTGKILAEQPAVPGRP